MQQILAGYEKVFERDWQSMMAQKLGLNAFSPETDNEFVTELQAILQLAETDMTIFYRQLAKIDIGIGSLNDVHDATLPEPLLNAYYVPEQLTNDNVARIGNWTRCYKARVCKDGTLNYTRRKRMNAVNPKYVLRNYLTQLAIDKAEQGDNFMVNEYWSYCAALTTNNSTKKSMLRSVIEQAVRCFRVALDVPLSRLSD
ncbi:MAG: protein adenylyltransferase SelO family protein [Candidatus Scalindua rubra]|nr:protein adenylyltransferase SelO family protein [Candidatus Scalindua rubra]